MTNTTPIGPSDEALAAVADHMLSQPPQQTLHWFPNEHHPGRLNAHSETHDYTISELDASGVILFIHPRRGNQDTPVSKTFPTSVDKAKDEAMRHHQEQLRHAETVAERLALLPMELEETLQRLMWQGDVGDGGLLEQVMCAWLGITDFDDPVLTTNIVHRARYPLDDTDTLAATPIPTPAPGTAGPWHVTPPVPYEDERHAVRNEQGAVLGWFLREADAVFCVEARNQRLKHAAAHTRHLEQKAD